MLAKPATMILGLIQQQPVNAYEILKVLTRMNIKLWFNLPDSTVYSTIKTLEKKNYISGRTEKVGNMPERTVYSITPSGEAELLATLRESLSSFDYDTIPFTIAGFFISAIDENEAVILLKTRLDILNQYVERMSKQISLLENQAFPATDTCNVKRMLCIVKAEKEGTQILLSEIEHKKWGCRTSV